MEHLGIKVVGLEEEEYCLIPMGGVLPRVPQRVLGIGGTAGMVHPSTGAPPSRQAASVTPEHNEQPHVTASAWWSKAQQLALPRRDYAVGIHPGRCPWRSGFCAGGACALGLEQVLPVAVNREPIKRPAQLLMLQHLPLVPSALKCF